MPRKRLRRQRQDELRPRQRPCCAWGLGGGRHRCLDLGERQRPNGPERRSTKKTTVAVCDFRGSRGRFLFNLERQGMPWYALVASGKVCVRNRSKIYARICWVHFANDGLHSALMPKKHQLQTNRLQLNMYFNPAIVKLHRPYGNDRGNAACCAKSRLRVGRFHMWKLCRKRGRPRSDCELGGISAWTVCCCEIQSVLYYMFVLTIWDHLHIQQNLRVCLACFPHVVKVWVRSQTVWSNARINHNLAVATTICFSRWLFGRQIVQQKHATTKANETWAYNKQPDVGTFCLDSCHLWTFGVSFGHFWGCSVDFHKMFHVSCDHIDCFFWTGGFVMFCPMLCRLFFSSMRGEERCRRSMVQVLRLNMGYGDQMKKCSDEQFDIICFTLVYLFFQLVDLNWQVSHTGDAAKVTGSRQGMDMSTSVAGARAHG